MIVVYAAVTTSTAIVLFLMLRSARDKIAGYKAQVRLANETAESAMTTARRMQTALRVAGEEIAKAKARRDSADLVIRKAEETISGAGDLDGLRAAWNELLAHKRDPDG